MSKYMLDTDTASYIIKGNCPGLLEVFAKNYQDCCISSISYAELHYGAAKRNSLPLTRKVHAFCELLRCVEWNEESAIRYAYLREVLEKQGSAIGSMDMLIAASAMVENAILVTNNTGHFSRIDGLKLDNWL